MNNLDLSIIIVSFNTKNLTVECLESIKKTVREVEYEIIVIDNASSDGSIEAISKIKDPKSNIILIKNNQNYGFSKANNIGVKKVAGRYILFLNPDTLVYEKTIDGMVKFMDKNPDVGASTCFVRLPSGKLDDASHRGFPTPWRAFSHFVSLSKIFPKSKFFAGYNLTYLNLDKTHEIDALAGAFMLVRREAGEQVGWWDEDFFWYGEDLDFCYKLRERGWKIYFVPEFEILHYKGASGGLKNHSKHVSTATDETRKKAHEARFAAMKIFYDKHYKNKYPSLLRAIVLWGINLKKMLTKITL